MSSNPTGSLFPVKLTTADFLFVQSGVLYVVSLFKNRKTKEASTQKNSNDKDEDEID